MSLPVKFKPVEPGQRSLSAATLNALMRSARAAEVLSFDPAHFLRQGNTISLRPSSDQNVRAPWELYQTDDLEVGMVNGILQSSNESGIPVTQSVVMANTTVDDDDTTYFYLDTDVEAFALGSYLYVWKVTAAAMVADTALPDPMNTLDLTDPIDGYGKAYFHIGTVEAAGGVLTITNEITDTLSTVYPMGILIGPFDCSDIGGT